MREQPHHRSQRSANPVIGRDSEIGRLVKERDDLSLEKIGARFGLCYERVRQIALRAGHARGVPTLPEEKIAAAHALIRDGVPIAHAAKMTDLNRKSLHNNLTRRGLHTPATDDRPWTPAEEGFLHREYDGVRGKATIIARALNRTRNEVIGKANRMGLCKRHPDRARAA